MRLYVFGLDTPFYMPAEIRVVADNARQARRCADKEVTRMNEAGEGPVSINDDRVVSGKIEIPGVVYSYNGDY